MSNITSIAAPDLTTAAPPEPAPAARGRRAWSALGGSVREYGILISLAIIVLFFQVATDGTLLQPLNLTNLVLQNSYIVIMALGMLMVIVAGHIDLSVGSTAGFVGALGAVLMVHMQMHYLPATLLCMAAGALIGAAQGYWVAYWNMPSFIVTLAGMLILRGLTLALLQGQSVGPFPDNFAVVSSGFMADFGNGPVHHLSSIVLGGAVSVMLITLDFRHRCKSIRYGMATAPAALFIVKHVALACVCVGFAWQLASYKGMPTVLLIMGVLIAIYAFVMNQTTIGRRIYAVGGNVKAARLSGVRTERVTFFTFVNIGVLAALAGLIFAARLNSATPKAGSGFELDVIAACFIGGASASGGVGKVMGAVIGAFMMGVMNNGMSLMGIGVDYQQVIKGLVLLAAVFLDVYHKNKL